MGEYVRCRNEHKMFQKEEIFQKRWKMFHPSLKEENQSGTRRKRGKENTRGAVVWISFLFWLLIPGLICSKKPAPFSFLLVASSPHPLEVKYFWAVVQTSVDTWWARAPQSSSYSGLQPRRAAGHKNGVSWAEQDIKESRQWIEFLRKELIWGLLPPKQGKVGMGDKDPHRASWTVN